MFDDNTCIAFFLSFSLCLTDVNMCIFPFFDSFFLCCTDVKIWYVN